MYQVLIFVSYCDIAALYLIQSIDTALAGKFLMNSIFPFFSIEIDVFRYLLTITCLLFHSIYVKKYSILLIFFFQNQLFYSFPCDSSHHFVFAILLVFLYLFFFFLPGEVGWARQDAGWLSLLVPLCSRPCIAVSPVASTAHGNLERKKRKMKKEKKRRKKRKEEKKSEWHHLSIRTGMVMMRH